MENKDIKFLIDNNLPIEAYLVLHFIHKKDKDALNQYVKNCGKIDRKTIDFLIINEYLCNPSGKLGFEDLQLTDKSLKIFKEDNLDWVDDWYELWPSGIKSAGYPIKSNPGNCKAKLKRFLKKYPKYTKEQIMEATKKYLNQMQQRDYSMCKLAPYFIEKEGMSVLAGEIDNLGEIPKENVTNKTSIGATEF